MARKKKTRKKSSKKNDGLLTERQRRDLLGLTLALLAVFTALSLVPASFLTDGDPDSNLLGVVGIVFLHGGREYLGAGIYLVPFLPALGAVAAFGLKPELMLRWLALVLVFVFLVPVGAGVVIEPGPVSPDGMPPLAVGRWGEALSGPLVAGLGAVGAGFLVAFLAVVACILTIGWNPIRTAVGGTSRGARVLGGAVKSVDPSGVVDPFRRLAESLRRAPSGGGSAEERGVSLAGEGRAPAAATDPEPEPPPGAGEPAPTEPGADRPA